MRLIACFIVGASFLGSSDLLAQSIGPAVRVESRAMVYRYSIPDDAIIYDDSTGRRMTVAEFAELNKADPRGHHLVPAYNEYGRPDHYRYRRTTAAERETGRFYDRDPALAPKPGQPMPLFVMKGLDGNEYKLAELAGKNIVLSFWVTFRPPFVNAAQMEALAKQINPAVQAGKVVSLGVSSDAPDQISGLLGSQAVPFIPVGDGRGFTEKYHVVSFPSVIVIDKTGKVVANLKGFDAQQLGNVLESLK